MKEWIKEHTSIIAVIVLGLLALLFYFLNPIVDQQPNGNQLESDFMNEPPKTPTEPIEEKTIMADIKGAIKNPGVYEAKEGERIIDLITRAGGLTEKADQAQVNLAMYVVDEMVLYIPEIGEVEQPGVASVGSTMKKDGLVNLNKADQVELETLPGIGPSKSAAIIEYRDTNGPFNAIEDIQSVSGFGAKTFEKLKDKITVK